MKRNKLLYAGALCAAAVMLVTGCTNPSNDSEPEDNTVTPKTISASDITASGATTNVTDKSTADSEMAIIISDEGVKTCFSQLGTVLGSAFSGPSTNTVSRSVALSSFVTDIAKIKTDLWEPENSTGFGNKIMKNIFTADDYSTAYSVNKGWNDIQLGIPGLNLSIPTCKADISLAKKVTFTDGNETLNYALSGAEEIHLAGDAALDPDMFVTAYNTDNPTKTVETSVKDFKGSVAVNSKAKINSLNLSAYLANMGTSMVPTADVLSASIAVNVAGNAGISFCNPADQTGGKFITAYKISCDTTYDKIASIIDAFVAKTATPTAAEISAFCDSLPVTVKFRMAFYNDAGEETYVYLDTTKLSDVVNFFSTMVPSSGGVTGGVSVDAFLSSILKK